METLIGVGLVLIGVGIVLHGITGLFGLLQAKSMMKEVQDIQR